MKNVNESGRSMVEMLGVLAIIGVLSVGGILGYTRAMNNWKANEILDAANRVLVSAQLDQTTEQKMTYADLGGDVNKIAGKIVNNITAYGPLSSVTTAREKVYIDIKANNDDVIKSIRQKLGCKDDGSEDCYMIPNTAGEGENSNARFQALFQAAPAATPANP